MHVLGATGSEKTVGGDWHQKRKETFGEGLPESTSSLHEHSEHACGA